MTDTDVVEAIHRHLDQHPDDWQARRELADLLEQAGDEAGAACQRWMVEARRRPWGPAVSWCWTTERSAFNDKSVVLSLLPDAVWQHLSGPSGPSGSSQDKWYLTRREAEEALAHALQAHRLQATGRSGDRPLERSSP